MARLAVGIAGGLVGAAFGFPQLGFLAGTIAGNILFPPPGQTVEGPRLGDRSISSSAYGVGIPIIYG